VVFVLICVWNSYGTSFKIAFAWSRPGLESAAGMVRADPTRLTFPRRIGLLPVEELRVDGADVRVQIEGAYYMVDSHRLLWSANPPPETDDGFFIIQSLGNDWYLQSN